jgi:hypothetical protein
MADTTVAIVPEQVGDARAVRIRGRRYPVLLPEVRDPRLHVAAVIVSVQVLGQAVLGFDVSVAQILLSIGTAAALELVIVARSEQVVAWPASALLTGNGVALILRTPGTVHGDWWSTRGWPVFVAASGVSLLSKYAIRVGDRHLFNPSNLGLVVVFLVFGSQHADPQDLWWGPWRPALAVTVGVILVGGLTLARRLRLFSVALTFWATFAAGIAVLAWSGHAITARWHVGAVTGWSYWWVFVASPEIVIFVFFMITDPRTAPTGRVSRPVYAASVGVVASVLAAFQRTEFATKVSLLAALTLVCALRPLLERWLPDDRFVERRPSTLRLAGALASSMAVAAGLVIWAGGAARHAHDRVLASVDVAAVGRRPRVHVPAGSVPRAEVSSALREADVVVSASDARGIVRDLVEDLAIDADAVRRGDTRLAASASFDQHLLAIEDVIGGHVRGELITASSYEIDHATVVLLRDPTNPQSVPQLGVAVDGTRTDVSRDERGRIVGQGSRSFANVLLVTRIGRHYLIGRALPADSAMVVRTT